MTLKFTRFFQIFKVRILTNFLQKFAVELYMSPVETWCHNINYFIPDEEGITKDFPMEKMARIRKYKTYFSK